jgi:hypothetical protein
VTVALASSERGASRILMFSQRNIFPNVTYRLGLYEFEDIVQEVDRVDLIAPYPTGWFKYGTRVANRLAADYAWSINPGIPVTRPAREYDLFVAVVQFPKDLQHVESLRGWKTRCRTSVCWMNELWLSEFHKYRYFLRLLCQFDYVVVHWAGTVAPLRKLVPGKCFYQPYGVDAELFCPYPRSAERVIDVYSIGRRSEVTHRALLDLTERQNLFYVYDSLQGYTVASAREHRRLTANMAKRSRYFLVNPGKVNAPGETQGQVEFGNRFFEGAAAGTIMIGETPQNDRFAEVFSWPDAVIHMPFDSADIGQVIRQLERDPDRQARIRRTNVTETLRRHDWVYRWEAILRAVGLEPLSELANRKARLAALARTVPPVVNGAVAGSYVRS